MDDRDAHFYLLVGRICESASMAKLEVRLTLEDGTTCEGSPLPRDPEGARELDDTGYGDALDFEGRTVQLSEVVEASVRRP
jgi:hypothetical protein